MTFEIEALKDEQGKILCQECNIKPAVGECGDPHQWLCRRCMEDVFCDLDDEETYSDDSLVFCNAEWDRQQV